MNELRTNNQASTPFDDRKRRMSDPVADGDEEAITAARTRLFISQRPALWLGQLSVALFISITFYMKDEKTAAIGWMTAHLILALIRLGDILKTRSKDFDDHQHRVRWLKKLALYTGTSGCIWGTGSILFIDAQALTSSVFLLLVMLSIVTGALPALTPYYPAFAAFITPIVLGVGLGWVLAGGVYGTFVVLLCIVAVAAYLAFGKNLADATTRSITLEHDIALRYGKLATLKEKAEQASAEKSRFLAAISHDVSQPLYAMMLFLDTLASQVPPQQQSLVEKLERNTKTLHEMFNSMVEVARLEQGTIETHTTCFTLRPLLANLRDEFALGAQQKNLSLTVSCPADLIVESDSVLLARILRNLLSNAIKYTDQGSVSLCAKALDNNSVHITVTDTGSGIAAEAQPHVFKEYWRAGNGDKHRRSKGLGLGLSVVKKLSELLMHPLWFESNAEHGTCFTLQVPRAQHISERPDHSGMNRDLDVTGLHVLVVEDDQAVAEALSTLLDNWGCLHTVADSGEEALKKITQHSRPPDLVISDYRLHGRRDGIETTAFLRAALDPQLPCLIVSGDFDEAVIARIQAQDLYYLAKPVAPAELRRCIAQLI